MAKRKDMAPPMEPNNNLVLEQSKDETGAQAMARKLLEPTVRHALTVGAFVGKTLGNELEQPGLKDYGDHLQTAAGKGEAGDLSLASRLLVSQALSLDSMFTEFARRSALNLGDYMNASEKYGRLALKAQANCRATLEALAKLHQPREQTVRHVHVNEGGQAVIADQFHNHTGGQQIAETGKQSHATGRSGESAALPCPDPGGNGVPIPGREGQAALQDARRD